jgi:hypothetical protein
VLFDNSDECVVVLLDRAVCSRLEPCLEPESGEAGPRDMTASKTIEKGALEFVDFRKTKPTAWRCKSFINLDLMTYGVGWLCQIKPTLHGFFTESGRGSFAFPGWFVSSRLRSDGRVRPVGLR